jgi:3-deoxy-manno-octulosonate cytidylyltransferase (CMP-KDO synthetase)
MNNPIEAIAMIPARYAATRFPAKLMQMLGNKTVIQHTYDNTVATGLFKQVWVITDSEIIYNEIINNGGNAKMSIATHESGSDRIAEAITDMDIEIVVNVQGDEPFVKKEPLQLLLQEFNNSIVQVASLMQILTDPDKINNPNIVKVTIDKNNNSLLFSRSAIPYYRDTTLEASYYEHVGVYAFRKKTLLQFTNWAITPLEAAEKLEQLRYLENGIPLKMVLTNFVGAKIDTPEDLEIAKTMLS